VGPAVQVAYGADLRDLLRRVTTEPCEVRQLALVHRLLSEAAAAAARAAAQRAGEPQVQCLGWAGHTAWLDAEGRWPAALVLGAGAVLAERTGITVVADPAARDLAAGGQGGPLAALPDFLLFRHAAEHRLLVHLGGTARLIYLPAGARPAEVAAFEAGPCNALLDALMRHVTGGREPFDPGGKHAVQGRCVAALVERWLGHPALQRRPPRALPRAEFADAFAARAAQQARELGAGPHDLLCSATHFVARAAAGAARRLLPGARFDRVLVSGGGARNGLLWRLLEGQFGAAPLERTDAVGVPADAREAVAAALLAALTLDGVPGNLPGATGAAGSRLLGNLTPGAPANWAACLAWMAAHAAAPDLRDAA
jgi:anhydro-N-acetylmuramic acid kinase